MICQNCKTEIPDDVVFCPHCGQKISSEETSADHTAPAEDVEHSQNLQNSSEEPGRGKATASMVLGIVAVVFFFTGLGAIVSVVCGIIGLVISNQSKAEGTSSAVRTAGFVLSLIGLIVGAIVVIASIILLVVAGSALSILGS